MSGYTYKCELCGETVLSVGQPSHMDTYHPAPTTIAAAAELVTGDERGFELADTVTAALISMWVHRQPALNTVAKVGLTALAELSRTDPDLSRSLAGELNG